MRIGEEGLVLILSRKGLKLHLEIRIMMNSSPSRVFQKDTQHSWSYPRTQKSGTQDSQPTEPSSALLILYPTFGRKDLVPKTPVSRHGCYL